ncbi:uncharacterized protein ACDP82_017140 [Pangshura tecta]
MKFPRKTLSVLKEHQRRKGKEMGKSTMHREPAVVLAPVSNQKPQHACISLLEGASANSKLAACAQQEIWFCTCCTDGVKFITSMLTRSRRQQHNWQLPAVSSVFKCLK